MLTVILWYGTLVVLSALALPLLLVTIINLIIFAMRFDIVKRWLQSIAEHATGGRDQRSNLERITYDNYRDILPMFVQEYMELQSPHTNF